MKLCISILVVFAATFGYAQNSEKDEFLKGLTHPLTDLIAEKRNESKNEDIKIAKKSVAKKTPLNSNFFSNLLNSEMKKYVLAMLKNNPFSQMKQDEVYSFVDRTLFATVVGDYFKKNPKWKQAFVSWLRDKEAMPALFQILNKPDSLKIYSYSFIGIMIFCFFLNLRNSKSGFIKKIMNKIFIFAGASVANFVVFCFLFYENIRPTFQIFYTYY